MDGVKGAGWRNKLGVHCEFFKEGRTYKEAEYFANVTMSTRLATGEEIIDFLNTTVKGRAIKENYLGHEQWIAVRSLNGTRGYIQAGDMYDTGGTYEELRKKQAGKHPSWPDWAKQRMTLS